jgi:hypothetical protein
LLLLAPLAESAGGWGICRDPKSKAKTTVFANTQDPDYAVLKTMCQTGQQRLDQIKRFDMSGFRPRKDWVREMKRYGILAPDLASDAPINVYATEQNYWRALWYQPKAN